MAEDQEVLKHVCKFCSKSFPCGRSLGGHMRSHVVTTEPEKEKLFPTRKALSSLNNNGGDTGNSEGGGTNTAGYGLRENPKKTWRIAGSSGEEEDTTLISDKKLCKECGKGFLSWKALFGHMKCHSEKERGSSNNNNSLEDQDSWTNNSAATTHKLVMDSQSDNEATHAPSNKKRRSKRSRTRYMVGATSSSVSTFANNPSSSSLSEVEQEQEEVAVSLMMLSRDVGPWRSGLHLVAESSDNNNSVYSEIDAYKKKRKWEFGNLVSMNLNSFKGKKSSELLAANGVPEKGFTLNKSEIDEKPKNYELDHVSALEEDSEVEHKKKSRANGTESSIKRRFLDSSPIPEAELSKNSHKRGKFECTDCNKVFHSYQALGGHRASHKKIKGCFASRNYDESSENSIETHEHSPEDPTTNDEVVVACFDDNDAANTVVRESKKNKVHECPICLKVFSSGQALGGHKRSHIAAGVPESSRNYETLVVVQEQEPVIPEVRDFLDLNLPAADATEEESNNRPWWVVEGNHKQEALVGLMSS